MGQQFGRISKGVEWVCRLFFGLFGLSVVGSKYRRSMAFGISCALNIQAGFSLIPYVNGHYGGAID